MVNNNKRAFLFDGEKLRGEKTLSYIEYGEHLGINEKYLTRNRKPWYALEKRGISKIWVSVFGRKGLKFIWNMTNCVNLTCFHAFYPSEYGRRYEDIIFIYLNTEFAKELLNREKREYGNGLSKFEPNDINKSYILNFDHIPENTLLHLAHLQKEYIEKKQIESLSEAERIFRAVFQSAQEIHQNQPSLSHPQKSHNAKASRQLALSCCQ